MNACSSCGRIQPLDAYGKRADTKLGVERTCKECRSEGRKLRRKAKLVEPLDVTDTGWRRALGDA